MAECHQGEDKKPAAASLLDACGLYRHGVCDPHIHVGAAPAAYASCPVCPDDVAAVVPSGTAACYVWPDCAPVADALTGWRWEAIGEVVTELSDPGAPWVGTEVDAVDHIYDPLIELYRQRLTHPEIVGMVEITSRPGRPMRMDVLDIDPRDKNGLGSLFRAYQTLREALRERKLGRPPGSGMMLSADRIYEAFQTCLHRTGHRPTQSEVAAEFPVSVATLKRELQRLGLPWPLDLRTS